MLKQTILVIMPFFSGLLMGDNRTGGVRAGQEGFSKTSWVGPVGSGLRLNLAGRVDEGCMPEFCIFSPPLAV